MKNLFNIIVFPIVIIFSLSCKKDVNPKAISTATTTTPSGPASSTPTPVVGRTLTQGTGKGDLAIDGNVLNVKCNDLIKIQAGTYTNINIKNINIGCPVIIQNDGLVQIVGNEDHMNLSNVSNLTISGTGTAGIDKGFVSRDNPQHRSIIINGSANNLTIQNFSFQNIGDYVIYFNNGQAVYNGNAGSYSENLKFLNNDCTNTQTFLQMDGDATNGIITGLVKNLEIANLSFTNSNCGNIIFVGNADDYNIHNNTITNINQTNNNHNGIFTIKGSGSFHHNLIRNHQGNAIRAWARSLGTTPKDILIYNNTVVNSRKYSAFEVQSFADEIMPGLTTYANAKVYNNICGDLDLSKDWVGVVVDVYNLSGGTCNVYNNIAFDFPAPNPSSNIVNIQSTTVPIVTNNSYFPTASAAGIPAINNLTIQK